MLFPFIGGSGLVARNSATLLDALPSTLTDRTPAGNTRVLAADGSLITEFYSNNRTPVTSDQIADVMKKAQVDIEDARFYEHRGLDVQGTLRALVSNVAAGALRVHAERMALATREQRLADRFTSAHPEVPIRAVPAAAGDVHDLDGLRMMGAELIDPEGDTATGTPRSRILPARRG